MTLEFEPNYLVFDTSYRAPDGTVPSKNDEAIREHVVSEVVEAKGYTVTSQFELWADDDTLNLEVEVRGGFSLDTWQGVARDVAEALKVKGVVVTAARLMALTECDEVEGTATHTEVAEYDFEFMRSAERLTGLSADEFDEFFGVKTDDERHQVRQLRAALFTAAVILIDELFMDHERLTGSKRVADTEPMFVLDEFPQVFHRKMDGQIAQKLIVAAVDLTTQLTAGWDGPRCVAEELLFHCLLNRVERVADSKQVDLPGNWRPEVEQYLLQDLDYQLLYLPQFDGIESNPPEGMGMANMDISHWFDSFHRWPLPPYIEVPGRGWSTGGGDDADEDTDEYESE
ncbi:hypothetical protein ACAG26_01275 [Mycobacterium sp. pUA109]|uniref:hypothetical protein n=1 Tax=Mycobacterium sp. pUA109 TaxID=3238982 RepID=UPI00351AD9AF